MKSFLVLFFFCFMANAQNEIFYNDLKIGREVESNISLIANIGRVSNPQFRYNVTENEWQYSDDGVSFTSLNDLIVDISSKADIDSPVFTGTPQAPTVSQGDDSNKIATTKYVDTAILSATIPDATETVKGKIQLAGDLEGTASLPKVKGLDDLKLDMTAAQLDISNLSSSVGTLELSLSQTQDDVSDIQDELLLKGDLSGPSSSSDNYIPVFDGATGKLLKSSSSSISTDGRLSTNYLSTALGGTSSIHGLQVTGSQVRSTDSNSLQLTAGTGQSSILLQGQIIPMGSMTYGVANDSVGGNNVTIDFQNAKYIRLNGVDLNTVTGINIQSGVTGAREISFFNSTNKEIRFVNDGFTTGKKLDLNTMPWIDLDVGKKISFTFNANTDKWVLDNPNDFFYSTIKNESGWTAFTPTGSWTNTTYKGSYRQVGDSLEIQYGWIVNGAVTGNLTLNLPIGFSIDYDKITPTVQVSPFYKFKNIGLGRTSQSGSFTVVASAYSDPVYLDKIFLQSNSSTSTTTLNVLGATSPANAITGSFGDITVTVPVKGLRSTVDIASQAMKYQELKNHETFGFYVNGANTPSNISNADSRLPFITGPCTRPENGKFVCPVQGLTEKPFCVAGRYASSNSGGNDVPFYDNQNSTASELIFYSRYTTAASNVPFNVYCKKLGQDAIEAFRSIALMAIKESNIYYDRDEFHTDERDTGRKWAGFSIYRKCFESPSMANNTVLVSGVRHTLGYYGYSGWGSDISPLPVTDGSGIRRVIRNPSNEARFMTSTSAPVMFCIEYTKL